MDQVLAKQGACPAECRMFDDKTYQLQSARIIVISRCVSIISIEDGLDEEDWEGWKRSWNEGF